MKNSSFPARMLSLLLAVAVLFGLASPAGAAASSNTLRYQQVDNSSVSANLLHPADQETDEAPQYSDTDIVRVSIVLEKASTLDAGFSTWALRRTPPPCATARICRLSRLLWLPPLRRPLTASWMSHGT